MLIGPQVSHDILMLFQALKTKPTSTRGLVSCLGPPLDIGLAFSKAFHDLGLFQDLDLFQDLHLFQDLGLDFCKVPKLSDKSKLRAKTACMGGGHVNHMHT